MSKPLVTLTTKVGKVTVALVSAVSLVALTACGSSSDTAASPGAASTSSTEVTGTVSVFAAASLKASFTAIGTAFEKAHPGAKVTFNFGPSSGLATSITQGNPADVFASASPTNMDAVVKAGAATGPVTFAKNAMEIGVPTANPATITALADLAKPGTKVARCADAVPCGKLAIQIFQNAGLTITPVDRPEDVNGVVKDITTGEVDAGIVYQTDVLANPATMKGITIPADVNASTSYPIVALTKAPNPAGAKAFTDFVLSSEGVSALTAAGFQKP